MKKWTRFFVTSLLTLMCVMTMLLPVCAAGNTSVSLPVTVNLTGPLPSKAENFDIQIQADDLNNPMPEGAREGKFVLTVTGKKKANSASFPAVTFDTVGVYDYTISQLPGSNKKCTYDKQVYSVRVYVTNNADMTGLETTVILYTADPDKDGDKAEKVDGVVFENKYPSDPNSPKTSDDSTPLLYAGLIAASVAVLVALVCTRKPKYSDED